MPFDMYKRGMQDHKIQHFLHTIRIQREWSVLLSMNVNYMLSNICCLSSLIVVMIIFVREIVFSNIDIKRKYGWWESEKKKRATERDGEKTNLTLDTIRTSIKWWREIKKVSFRSGRVNLLRPFILFLSVIFILTQILPCVYKNLNTAVTRLRDVFHIFFQ